MPKVTLTTVGVADTIDAKRVDLHLGSFLRIDGEQIGKIDSATLQQLDPTSIALQLPGPPGRQCEIEFEDTGRAQAFVRSARGQKKRVSDARASTPAAPTERDARDLGSGSSRARQPGLARKPGSARRDDFGNLSQNTLSSVGGFMAGSQIQDSRQRPQAHPCDEAPRPEKRQQQPGAAPSAGGANAGSLYRPRAQAGQPAAAATTPQPMRSERALMDEMDEKRQKIDEHCGTLRTTPEKSRPVHLMRRAAPAHASSVLSLDPRSVAAQLHSAAYSGYRSAETFGLRNLGNTCYLNAIMQACGSLREFVADLCAMPDTMLPCKEGKLFSCTVDILQQLATSSAARGPLNPGRLREQIAVASPMFGRNEQQDAHEFLLEYMNQLHDELLAARGQWLAAGGVDPVVAENFAMATHSHLDSELHKKLQCVKCQESRSIRERFRDFSLDFDGGEGSGSCTLASMLRAYFSPEELEATCEHCAGTVAHMEKALVSPPRTLVLHMKRFVPNLERQRYDKQHQSVNFPQRFDLQSCLKQTAPRLPARPFAQDTERGEKEGAAPALWYNLRALVSHDGPSPHSGHYVSYAQSDSGTWKLYDDSIVRDLGSAYDPQRELGRSAYILFYVLEPSEGGR